MINFLDSIYLIVSRIGCIGIVLIFDILLWFASVEIYPIHFIKNSLASLDTSGVDFIADILLAIFALSLQLGFRLYLRYVKQITESNEILSIKIILVLLSCYFSYFLPLPSTSQGFISPYAFVLAMVPTLIMYDHFGFRTFFMENHPKLKTVFLLACEFFMKYSNKIQPSNIWWHCVIVTNLNKCFFFY